MRQLKHVAADKKEGMTLAELSQFVQEALQSDVDPRTPVKITNGFRRQLQEIEVKG